MDYRTAIMGAFCAVALAASPALAADQQSDKNTGQTGKSTAAQSGSQNARQKGDASARPMSDKRQVSRAIEGEWLSLTGKVKSTSDDEFTMNYGKGQILIDMDDYDWYDKNALKAGDKVTVTGRLDDAFYKEKQINATSIYIAKNNEYHYSTDAGEAGGYYSYPATGYGWGGADMGDGWVSMTGTVKSVGEDQLTLNTGSDNDLKVDVGGMENNPLDKNRIKAGDRVSVSGEMDEAGLFDNRELEASSIVKLSGQSG